MARKQNIFQIAWSSECDDHAFDPVMCAIEVAQCGELWLVGMRLEMFTKELLERPWGQVVRMIMKVQEIAFFSVITWLAATGLS
jgi:hypothetical protein